VGLLTAKLDLFRAEEEAVFAAGLRASGFVSVDDTGARHAGKACYTTQFGSDRFTAFRTGPSKSLLAFLGARPSAPAPFIRRRQSRADRDRNCRR
jgi:hypothetical protein